MDKQKELLLKDLCARLPYGVIVQCDTDHRHKFDEKLTPMHLINFYQFDTKPYLRPMSSMTRAEVLEYISLKENIVASDGITYFFETYKSIDWLNKKMFDYRKDDEGKTMIEKGLALEAPEGMYK